MNTETLSRPETAPVDLAFMNEDAINQLRLDQQAAIDEAHIAADEAHAKQYGSAFTENDKLSTEKQLATSQSILEANRAFLNAHISQEDDPDLYEKLEDLLDGYSVINMSVVAWNNGTRNSSGKFENGTSGRDQLNATMYTMVEEQRPAAEPEPTIPTPAAKPDTDPHADENKRLRQELKDAQDAKRKAEAERATAEQDLTELAKRHQRVVNERDDLQSRQADITDERDDLARKRADAEAERSQAEAERDSARIDRDQAEQERDTAYDHRNDALNDLDRVTRERDHWGNEHNKVADERDRIAKAHDDLLDNNDRLADVNRDLIDENDQLIEDRKHHNQELQDAKNAPAPVSNEQLSTAEKRLELSRDHLAKLSTDLRRRWRKHGRKTRELEAAYQQAKLGYEHDLKELGMLEVRAYRERGVNNDTIRANVMHNLLTEHQAFSMAELKVLQNDKSLRGRVARLLSKGKAMKIVNFMTGSALGLAAHTVAGPAGTVVAVGLKAAKEGVMNSVQNQAALIREHGRRALQDQKWLRNTADHRIDESDTHEDMVTTANSLYSKIRENRIAVDRKGNRKRFRRNMAASTLGVLAGAGAGVALEHAGALPDVHIDGLHLPNMPHLPHITGNHGGNSVSTGADHPSIEGFKTEVNIHKGEGYQHLFKELAAQKDIHLSDEQSWALYKHLNGQVHGHFFADDPSYNMGHGNVGISRPGVAHWDPKVIHGLNDWLAKNHK